MAFSNNKEKCWIRDETFYFRLWQKNNSKKDQKNFFYKWSHTILKTIKTNWFLETSILSSHSVEDFLDSRQCKHVWVQTPHLDVLSKITLCPDQNKRNQRGVFVDLRYPFFWDILEGGRTDHTEAQQEHICTGVAQGAELIKLILEENKTGIYSPQVNLNRESSADSFVCMGTAS